MTDVELGECGAAILRSASPTPSPRWRSLAAKSGQSHTSHDESNGTVKTQEKENFTTSDKADETEDEDVDIESIRYRTYLLSAGIGDTNRTYNKYKGWIGLIVWCLNFTIHFSLDFYEAVFVFHVSWATCIGLFLIALSVGSFSMIRHSVPWFIKAVRKLKKDGHYPKTLRRMRLIFKVSLIEPILPQMILSYISQYIPSLKKFLNCKEDPNFISFFTIGSLSLSLSLSLSRSRLFDGTLQLLFSSFLQICPLCENNFPIKACTKKWNCFLRYYHIPL